MMMRIIRSLTWILTKNIIKLEIMKVVSIRIIRVEKKILIKRQKIQTTTVHRLLVNRTTQTTKSTNHKVVGKIN